MPFYFLAKLIFRSISSYHSLLIDVHTMFTRSFTVLLEYVYINLKIVIILLYLQCMIVILSLTFKDNIPCPTNEYGLEDMTFAREEEVYPAPEAPESSITEEKESSTKVTELKSDLKRKQPDKPTEKKVAYSYLSHYCVLYTALQFLNLLCNESESLKMLGILTIFFNFSSEYFLFFCHIVTYRGFLI